MRWLPWLPFLAACCHIFEEFVWPGGFADWYRKYRANAARITTRVLVIVNVALLAACVNYALLANTALGAAALLGLSALLCSNGLWHAWASVMTHTVSPGVVTGMMLYIPLMIVEGNGYLRGGRTPLWAAAIAIALGGSYQLWSALYHRAGLKASVNRYEDLSLD